MTTASDSRVTGPDSDRALQRVRDSLAKQNMLVTLGVEVVEVAPGRVVLDLPIRTAVTQQNGFVHAGAITTLADAAAGAAALSLMPEGKDVLSVEFKVNLLKPGVGERLRATATVVRSGRTLTVVGAGVHAVLDGEEVPDGEDGSMGAADGGSMGAAGGAEPGTAVEYGVGGQAGAEAHRIIALMQATMIAVDRQG